MLGWTGMSGTLPALELFPISDGYEGNSSPAFEEISPAASAARITYQAGDLKRSHMKVGGGSYLSSHDPRMVLGVGKREKMDWLEVKWPIPGGTTQRFRELPINRYITIIEGESKLVL